MRDQPPRPARNHSGSPAEPETVRRQLHPASVFSPYPQVACGTDHPMGVRRRNGPRASTDAGNTTRAAGAIWACAAAERDQERPREPAFRPAARLQAMGRIAM
jgi:hypothetical protein